MSLNDAILVGLLGRHLLYDVELPYIMGRGHAKENISAECAPGSSERSDTYLHYPRHSRVQRFKEIFERRHHEYHDRIVTVRASM